MLLTACCLFLNGQLHAQANCSNPLVVDICPPVYLTGQTNAGMLNDAPLPCNITGEDLVYQINAPNGTDKLFVNILNATASMKVWVSLNTCTASCSYKNAYAGNNYLTFNVSSVNTYFLWIDAASTVTFNISIGGDTGNVYVNIPSTKGNIRVDSSICATPVFGPGKKFLQVSYNSVIQTMPMTLAPLNVPGTMCITTFLKNKTGIEAIKKFTFQFLSSGYASVSPVTSVLPGFYNPGAWTASYAGGIWTFLFTDSAGTGKGDFKPPPDSCLRYTFCFTLTPLNNIPNNTNVAVTMVTDGFGTGFNGYVHYGCCPNLSPTCLGATPAPGGVGSGTTFGFSFNDPGFLPVELLSYDAQVIKDQVKLTWITASESNNNYFTIDRSPDAKSWETVGQVPGVVFSSTNRSYELTDEHPLTGISYYRLQQTDLNGQSVVCGVKSIRFDGSETIRVYPNPAKDKLFIESGINGSLHYYLYNGLGSKIAAPVIIVNGKASLNLTGMDPGVYMLVIAADEKIMYKEKIIIQQ